MPAAALILVSVVGWGLWGVLDKLALRSLHPAQAQLVTVTVGLLTAPACGWLLCRQGQSLWHWDGRGTGFAVAAGIMTSIASLAYVFALESREATRVVSLTAAYPLVTCVAAAVLLRESISLSRLGGVALIAAGVWALSR